MIKMTIVILALSGRIIRASRATCRPDTSAPLSCRRLFSAASYVVAPPLSINAPPDRGPSSRRRRRDSSSVVTIRDSRTPRLRLRATTEDENESRRPGTWNPLSLAVLKLKFTEPAWTSSLNYANPAVEGRYLCAYCKSPLFSSGGKYDSGTGWPSFWKTIDSNRVKLEREWDGRIECSCANWYVIVLHGLITRHLGHVFPDGPARGALDACELVTVPDTDPKIGYKVGGDEGSEYSRMPRFCINGAALRFEEGG
ncbi:hypothetical protein ACHAXA_007774 [Cyclostephanos tholiformis]|uniref:peptide-methionine (R)-S-oxide reductase n=1 Tax=Cyclostephanos tholiformis TaxID=382380 RepID=A0ABD3R9Q8_9STRA